MPPPAIPDVALTKPEASLPSPGQQTASSHWGNAATTRSWGRFGPLVAAAFVILLVLQGVLICDGISRPQSIGASFREVVTLALPAEQHARSMASAAQNRIILMLRMLAEPDPFERETDARAFAAEGLRFGLSTSSVTASWDM